jgi:cation diffusion facilitator family transporter
MAAGHGHSHGHEHGHAHQEAGHGHAHGQATHGLAPPQPSRGHAHGDADGGHEHTHGVIDPAILESRQGVRVLAVSLGILGLTAVIQAVVVAYTGSVALLADTIHNVGDSLTAVPLAVAFILARRAPTARYTYGLKRSEDVAGLLIVAAITFSAGVALYESIERLINQSRPDHLVAGILAGALGFVGNEWVAVYRMRQGRKMHSAALVADGYHARIDGFTSLAVVVGLSFVWIGWKVADPIIGILISITIIGIAARATRDVGRRILDGIEPETVESLRSAADSELNGLATLAHVRARWLGHEIHAEIGITPAEHTTGEQLLDLRERITRRIRDDHEHVREIALDVVGSKPRS